MTVKFAQVSWTAADVLKLAPGLTEDQAEAWLEHNGKYILERMTLEGWGAMEALLAQDGIPVAQ